jgi:hypothetical protein
VLDAGKRWAVTPRPESPSPPYPSGVLIWTKVAQGKKQCSASEQRKRHAALRYDLKMESRKVGWGDPALVFDEEKALFRFRDGRFAFSRDHADWELLRERERMKER